MAQPKRGRPELFKPKTGGSWPTSFVGMAYGRHVRFPQCRFPYRRSSRLRVNSGFDSTRAGDHNGLRDSTWPGNLNV